MNLYLVQDNDRPIHVAAVNWEDALFKWKTQIARENDLQLSEVSEPLGIHLLAQNDDSEDFPEYIY